MTLVNGENAVTDVNKKDIAQEKKQEAEALLLDSSAASQISSTSLFVKFQ